MEAASATDLMLVRDGGVPAAPSHGYSSPTAGQGSPIAGAVSCACCSRVPLVGEVVTAREYRKSTRWVCEPCSVTKRRARRGRELRSVRIRSFGGALNVRRAA